MAMAAAVADGVGDLGSFDPARLFTREAAVMERWGPIYVVHVLGPADADGIRNFVQGQGADPMEACMRAFVRSRAGQ